MYTCASRWSLASRIQVDTLSRRLPEEKDAGDKVGSIFRIIDKNGNGKVTKRELIWAARNHSEVRDVLGLKVAAPHPYLRAPTATRPSYS